MNDRISRRTLVLLGTLLGTGALAGLPGQALGARAAVPSITIYKDPACSCCGAWVDHLKAAGFKTTIAGDADIAAINRGFGVPDDLSSCHTGVVAGYAVVGHVPASDVKRLLATRPRGKGLAVPGMPANSPGMETPGEPNERYTVWLFQANGKRNAFASHG